LYDLKGRKASGQLQKVPTSEDAKSNRNRNIEAFFYETKKVSGQLRKVPTSEDAKSNRNRNIEAFFMKLKRQAVSFGRYQLRKMRKATEIGTLRPFYDSKKASKGLAGKPSKARSEERSVERSKQF
jgi:hypothetical protein